MLSFVGRTLCCCCRFAVAAVAAAAAAAAGMQSSPEQIPNSAYRIPALLRSLVQRMVFRFYYILLQSSLLVWRGGSGGGGSGGGDVGGGASVWMFDDVDAFTDLNLNKTRKYSSLVTAGRQAGSRYTDTLRVRSMKINRVNKMILIGFGCGLRCKCQ